MFEFDSDAGGVREFYSAVDDGVAVGEAAEGLEYARIRFVAVKAHASGYVEGELVASVGNATAR